ncbi:hypothetical protein [Aliarcobacter butzleri]|uniref:hypothetical protein n=1 Tax=Aliarcobacter butzleri TaxID=28197 RepID=UPI0012F982B5|nr:hypothetical protein [Aliarcobacter butzleri]
MNIKKIIKISFMIMLFIVLVIGIINTIIIYQIRENNIKVWLDIFANGITKDLTTKQKEIFKEEVEKILKNKIYSEEFGWLADYVRLRVVANKL